MEVQEVCCECLQRTPWQARAVNACTLSSPRPIRSEELHLGYHLGYHDLGYHILVTIMTQCGKGGGPESIPTRVRPIKSSRDLAEAPQQSRICLVEV